MYVLVRIIPDWPEPGEDWHLDHPAWARVLGDHELGPADTLSIKLDPAGFARNPELSQQGVDVEASWWIRKEEVVPDDEVTDEQWAELAAWRFTE